MTLSTDFNILDPVNRDVVWPYALSLVVPPGVVAQVSGEDKTSYLSAYSGRQLRETTPGQGLNAWLMMHYNADGSEIPIELHAESGEVDFSPPYFINLNFDTGYSYRDAFGGCTALHARIIFALGQWCIERNLRFIWKDEYSGRWYADLASLETFLRNGDSANTWFEKVARPFIDAEILKRKNRVK